MTAFKPHVLKAEIEIMRKSFEALLPKHILRGVIHGAGFNHDLSITDIVEYRLRYAAEQSLTAGYGGASNDGGAAVSLFELVAFCRGIAFIVDNPDEAISQQWKEYAEKCKKDDVTVDPEYQLYLELKKKFE
jgi:hypothetical protein